MDYKCICGKQFKYYYLLVRHQENRVKCQNGNNHTTDNIDSSDDDNICNICDKEFSNKYNLKRHRIACMKKSADEIEEHKSTIEHFQDDLKRNISIENSDFVLSSLLSQISQLCGSNTGPTEQYLTNLVQTLQTLNKQKKDINPNNVTATNNISNSNITVSPNNTTDNSTTNITNNTTNSNMASCSACSACSVNASCPVS
jgi:hypothetical protein